jgi:hypothetical protein
MTPRERYPDCAERVDAAPYVLGALEDAERYREHLAGCPACRAEVAELQLVVDRLPAIAAPAAAPAGLRERVLATVRSEAELLRAAGHQADLAPRSVGRFSSRRLGLATAGVAVAVSAALAVAITIGLGTSASERVTPARIAAVAQGAHASLHQRDGRAELLVSDMPQPPPGKIYEVWLSRRAGSPTPTDALFGVTSRGAGAVDVPDSLRGVKEVLVTSEPLGGSLRPTSPPVIRVVLAT